jgi:hypothetical protein
MRTRGSDARLAWIKAYPTPATEQQLKTLCELHGLNVRISGATVPGAEAAWVITSRAGRHVCRFWISSPIERYIARIAEWRREQV